MFSFHHTTPTVVGASLPTTTLASIRGASEDLSTPKCNDVKINMSTDGEYYSFKVGDEVRGRIKVGYRGSVREGRDWS